MNQFTISSIIPCTAPGVYDARLLVVVGDDAADEVGVGLVERRQQRLQLRPEGGRHSLVLLRVLPCNVARGP